MTIMKWLQPNALQSASHSKLFTFQSFLDHFQADQSPLLTYILEYTGCPKIWHVALDLDPTTSKSNVNQLKSEQTVRPPQSLRPGR